jgi:hypothetical protein
VEKILSLSEITEIEQAYKHGAPTLGAAAEALLRRWRHDLRDQETCVRLLFLIWYGCAEPPFLTGLEKELPSAQNIIDEIGGEGALPAETLFVLGVLASMFPYCFEGEAVWESKSRELLKRATELEPASRLFADWAFFVNEASSTMNLRTRIAPEIHARFNGRGALGEYMLHILTGVLWNTGAPEKHAPG